MHRPRPALMLPDCIVVGGGIIGMLSAYELSLAGAKVTLLERGRLGREASWAGAGVLAPLHPWNTAPSLQGLIAHSQALYPDLARELHSRTGIDCEWRRSGLLVLNPSIQAIRWAQGQTGAAPIETETLATMEPEVGAARGAIRIAGVAQIRNPRLLRALAADLRKRGVTVREQVEVTGIQISGRRVTGVSSPARAAAAAQVVLAGGAWCGSLLEPFGPAPAIEPARGQILLYRAPEPLIRHILVRGEHYAVPRKEGRMLVGSTLEYVGFDRSTTPEAKAALHASACAMVPALVGCPIEAHWAGLRPASARGIPCIGAHPEIDGLFMNMGHFRLGLTLAPGSARLLADLVAGRAPCVSPEPFAWPTNLPPPTLGVHNSALRRTLFNSHPEP
jgi:glycine oxidase